MANEIGITLRQLRTARGLTCRALAERMGCTHSYVSKVESGRLYPSQAYVDAFTTAAELAGPEAAHLHSLLQLYESESHPIGDEPGAREKRQRAIATIEAGAVVTRSLCTVTIPGLLQTPDFARCVFETAGLSGKELEKTTKARLSRQRSLRNQRKRFHFVISESALRNVICTADVLRGQVEHLSKESHRHNVTISFIPWASRLPVLPATSFDLLDDKLVFIDLVNGFITLRSPCAIAAHLAAFNRLDAVAVGTDDFAHTLLEIVQGYERGEAASK